MCITHIYVLMRTLQLCGNVVRKKDAVQWLLHRCRSVDLLQVRTLQLCDNEV